jgi:hypothetical protein
VAAAIAASNAVLPLIGGMALSEASLLGEALSRRIRLVPKGCTLVLLDGNSVSIGGMHNLENIISNTDKNLGSVGINVEHYIKLGLDHLLASVDPKVDLLS